MPTLFINRFLSLFGVKLSRIPAGLHHDSLSFAANTQRLLERSISINTIIDIGASNGCWSEKLMPVYPNAFYLLVEANSVHLDGLKQFKSMNANSDYVLAVAGSEKGNIYFDSSNPFGGIASYKKTESCNSSLPCISVDDEVKQRGLKGPYLLKLDTHGFEVPIFDGAEKTLENTNIIFVETYNFDIEEQSLRFWEMCQFLYEKGFRPIDLCEPMHRPGDSAFWQIDILFAKNDSIEFQSNKYA